MGIKKLGAKKYRVLWTDEVGREHRKVLHGSKEEAEAFLVEQKLRVARIKDGLEVRDRNPGKLTVAKAAKAFRAARASSQVTQTVRDYIEETDLAGVPLERVTTAMLRVHLDGLVSKAWRNEQARLAEDPEAKPRKVQASPKLGPTSLNHVREYLVGMFQRAIDNGEIVGANPAKKLKKARAPKYAWTTLTVEEIEKLLEKTPMPDSAMIAAALLALRKGEIFGLDVADVDVDRWELHVRRSHSRSTTKSGRARIVPIHPALRPFFVAAIEASHGGVLFPGRKDPKTGAERRRHKDGDLSGKLKEHLAAAGIAKRIRWHDLRHTAATLMLQAGAPIAHVSRVLGHSSIAITADRYGHLVTEDLRAAVERIPFKIEPKVVNQ